MTRAQEPRMQQRYPNLKFLILTLPLIVFLVWSAVTYVTLSRVAMREARTIGVVKTYDASNHGRYGFQYEVSGIVHDGWHYPGYCPPDSPRIGESSQVFYDPRNPSKAELCRFSELSRSELGPLPFIVVLVVIIVLIARYKT
jgi:hypothetical protein